MRPYLQARQDVLESAEPGTAATRRLCELTDEAVRELALAASARPHGRWAVLALGGWGAGALLPASDLDILILTEHAGDAIKKFVEEILYPLWDGALKVGHQVRTPREQVRAMREDTATCTAALSARPIAGDIEWARTSIATWRSDARKRSRRLLAALHERPRPGSPYALDVDLKQGAGGRRDFDEICWTAAILSDAAFGDLSVLDSSGLLRPDEVADVLEACERLAAVRWTLQKRGFGDTLTTESAEGVDAESANRALAATDFVLAALRRRLASRSRRADAPSGRIDAATLFSWLTDGEIRRQDLERAAFAGMIEHLVPGLQSLMSCRRPGLGHELTVGAHSIKTAALTFDNAGKDPTLAESLAAIEDPRVAWIAALAHDAGKLAEGPKHAERGAPVARQAALACGLSEDEAQQCFDLVSCHLVLSETALRDDLDDEDAILRTAGRIGRADLLAPLHALTVADSKATGASTWNGWTAALVGTLVARLETAFSPRVNGAGVAARGERVRSDALSHMSDADVAEQTFVRDAPLRYLASRDADEVLRHAALVAELSRQVVPDAALVAVSAGPVDGTHVVTVAALDRAELLARTSGALSLAGLDILSVDAYSAGHGLALDSFVVKSSTRRSVSPETFAQFERLLHAALRDRLELAVRLAERRKHYPPSTSGVTEVATERLGWATVLEIRAPDRPGLLHDIAMAVASADLDIKWARIQTVDGIARDVFHLAGPDGGPVDDPGVLGHVAMNVRSAV